MNLPNYFLADLPPEAALSPSLITEACHTLKRNRESYLATRSTASLVNTLSQVARSWLAPDYSFRKLALEQGPAATGFSAPTLASGLDTFFKQLTRENLLALLEQDLGHAQRLDQMIATGPEQNSNRAAVAHGPEFLAHIAAGKLPNPTFLSIALGVLVRSAQFVKCASGTSFFPRLFAHSLYEADPKLAACLEIAEWRGGNADLENTLFEQADCVTATGTDETLTEIRHRLSSKIRFLGYGHRVSFAYVASAVLGGLNGKKVIARAAADVVAWNQLGCLSPHVIYVESGGAIPPLEFAELLAKELARLEELEPRGELPVEISGALASRRAIYELRAAHSLKTDPKEYPLTRLWSSPNSTAWTVIYEEESRFQMSCLNRFVYVKGVSDLTQALQGAEIVRGKVSTVGLGAPEDKAESLATQLARWGVTRICPLGQMQNPSLSWRHDGQPAFGDLITWSDWEQ